MKKFIEKFAVKEWNNEEESQQYGWKLETVVNNSSFDLRQLQNIINENAETHADTVAIGANTFKELVDRVVAMEKDLREIKKYYRIKQ